MPSHGEGDNVNVNDEPAFPRPRRRRRGRERRRPPPPPPPPPRGGRERGGRGRGREPPTRQRKNAQEESEDYSALLAVPTRRRSWSAHAHRRCRRPSIEGAGGEDGGSRLLPWSLPPSFPTPSSSAPLQRTRRRPFVLLLLLLLFLVFVPSSSSSASSLGGAIAASAFYSPWGRRPPRPPVARTHPRHSNRNAASSPSRQRNGGPDLGGGGLVDVPAPSKVSMRLSTMPSLSGESGAATTWTQQPPMSSSSSSLSDHRRKGRGVDSGCGWHNSDHRPHQPKGNAASASEEEGPTSFPAHRHRHRRGGMTGHRRPFPNRKRARLSSIVRSIEALLAIEQQQQQESQLASSHATRLTTALRALADAATPSHVVAAGSDIERCLLGDENDDGNRNKNMETIAAASVDGAQPCGYLYYSPTVLDLVLRATALTGLMSLSAQLWEHVLQNRLSANDEEVVGEVKPPRLDPGSFDSSAQKSTPPTGADSVRICDKPIPSYSTQEVICHAYRRAGRLSSLRHVAQSLQRCAANRNLGREEQCGDGASSRICGPVMSTVAFNMILAAHCDPTSTAAHSTAPSSHSPASGLNEANRWLGMAMRHDQSSSSLPWVDLDAVSFATVLQACARGGNATLAQSIWDDMLAYRTSDKDSVTPNVVAYNARLQLAVQQPHASSQSIRDAAALKVWKELIEAVQPDQYSIDWIIMPLLRSGREAMLGIILNHFVAENSQSVASVAFTAFLTTVVQQSGNVTAARKLFDKYLRPSLSPVISGPVGTIRLVRPSTRHFNVLLTGYQTVHYQQERAREAANQRRASSAVAGTAASTRIPPPNASALEFPNNGESNEAPVSPLEEAMALYRLMGTAQDCQPNEITRTIVLSMCTSGDDIVEVVLDDLEGHKERTGSSQLHPSVLRAAIMAAGNAGEAGLAAWLYASLGSIVVPTDESNVRTWNVLVGAMAKADSLVRQLGREGSPTIDVQRCSQGYGQRFSEVAVDVATSELCRMFQGKTILDAFNAYLIGAPSLDGGYPEAPTLPKPNSQTYCLIASVFQRRCPSAGLALSLFRNATQARSVPADGRFVNAVLRCFGDDLDRAVEAWKDEIRPATLAHDARTRSSSGKGLTAAYHGLLYVCGRAVAPQMALRVVYAMRRDGLDPDETALNCYHSGTQDQLLEHQRPTSEGSILPKIADDPLEGNVNRAGRALMRIKDTLLLKDRSWYESLLLVECTQYNLNDRRRMGEQRVRIIV